MTEKQTALQRIADAYEGSPIVRALVQVVMAPIPYGIGSAIDAALTSAIENMREERLRTFFDELVKGTRHLTEELIQEEDFLHAYFSTLKAAMNTRRREKIRLFARMLSNAFQERRLGSDIFEEFLGILDDLSVRELQILLILKRLEDSHPHEMKAVEGAKAELENDLQRATRFWDSFEATVETECGVRPDELRAILTRLNRTGLYETFIGGYYGYTGGKGKLTPMFAEFAEWLQVKGEGFAKQPASEHARSAP